MGLHHRWSQPLVNTLLQEINARERKLMRLTQRNRIC